MPDELEQLERATSCSAGSASSPEEIELREGWSTLSHLTREAEAASPFDERAFLEKLSGGVLQSPVQRPYLVRAWHAAAVLAAAALVCAAIVGYVASMRPGASGLAGSKGIRPDSRDKLPEQGAVAQGISSQWDDALDERIGFVHQSLFQLRTGSPTRDESLESFGILLEQFRREIDEGPL
jgi:hypothetical protein